MSLAVKPHTAIIRPVVQRVLNAPVAGERQLNGPEVAVRGYKEDISAGDAKKDCGLTLRKPAVFLCDLADAALFVPQSEVQIGASTYTMHGEPIVSDAGDPCDHATIFLEFKQFPLFNANQ